MSNARFIIVWILIFVMKMLVYGFGPYGAEKENITEKIIRKIRNRKNLKKVVFPVKFEKKIFLEKIKKHKPDKILGLGECHRGKKFRIERKAVNLRRAGKGKKLKIISKNKPKYLFMNLRLKKDKNSWVSYRPGKYVCDFSRYVISDFSENIRFAFIHIPYDYDLNKAVKLVESRIDEILSLAA